MTPRRVVALTPPVRIFAEIGRVTSVRMHLTELAGSPRDLIVRVLGNLTGPLPAQQIRVEADQTIEIDVSVSIPHGMPPGQHNFLFEVVDRDTGSVLESLETSVDVQHTKALRMHMSPASIRRRRRGRVRLIVRNHDEETQHLRLRAEPDDAETQVKLELEQLSIRPGEVVRVSAKVKSKAFYFGKQKERWYSIIGEGAGVPVYSRGNVRQMPMIGKNVKGLFTLLTILIVWAASTLAVIRLVSPATTESTAGAEGTPVVDDTGEQDGAGAAGAEPILVDVNGTVTAVPDGSGVVVSWRTVSLGDAATGGKVAAGTATESPDVALQQTQTDETGAFVVAGLDALGLYEFSFSKAGHQTKTLIVQPNGQPVTLEVVLEPGTGFIGGLTVDASGSPLGGVDVTLTDGAITYSLSTPTSGDDLGRFAFRDLSSPATYVLDARVAGRGLASTTLDLATGQAIDDLRLVLSPNVATLAGKITAAAFESGSTAAADFRVAQDTVGDFGPSFTITATDGTLTRSTTTLTEGLLAGTFRLEQLPVGRTYTVTYEAPGFQTLTEQIELTISTPEREISMVRSTGRLRGKVTISGSSLSPTAVAVTVTNPDNTYKTTDAISSDGSLLVDGIVPGAYVVVFEALGLEKQVREVDIGAGTSTELNVTLSPTRVSAIKSSLSFKVTKGGNDTTTTVSATVRYRAEDDCGKVGADSDCTYEVNLSDGNLVISGLEAGGYVIDFTAEGFAPLRITAQVAASTDAAQREIELVPLGNLQGQVTDDTSTPIQGLTLRLLKEGTIVATTTTSATGEFLFVKKLTADPFSVEVVSSNYAATPRSLVGALAATLNLDVSVRGLSLITGEAQTLDLLSGEYRPYNASDFNVYIRNGTLGSTWVDASTLGLAKSLGSYRLGVAPSLNDDDSRVSGSTVGYDVCLVAIEVEDTAFTSAACDAPVVGLEARTSSGIDLRLTEAATRSYYITPDPGRIAGSVTVNGSAAGEGLSVEARRVDSSERVIETVSIKTNASGIYEFTNLTPVRPVPSPAPDLTAEASLKPCDVSAGACWIVRASAEGTGFTDSDPLMVFPGTNATISALAISQQIDTSLTITVLDIAGDPIVGATVSAVISNNVSLGNCGPTDANGQCTIADPPSGTVAQITAQKAGYRDARGSIGITPGQLALSLTMSPARTVVFTAVNATGTSLANVTVSATDALGVLLSCLTDGSGQCPLSGLAPGPALVTAELTGYQFFSSVIAVEAAADGAETITLSIASSGLSGLVTTSANTPVVGANLTATKGAIIVSGTTNGSGQYFLPGLDEGSWDVVVTAPGFVSASATAVIAAGASSTLNLTLTPLDGILEISVRTSGGNPIDGVTVSAYTTSAKTTLVSTTSSSNGIANLTGLAAGQYWILVEDGTDRFVSQEFLVNIDRGYTTRLPVYLGSTKSVVVIGVAGIPASGFGPQTPLAVSVGLDPGGGGTVVTASAVIGFAGSDRAIATFTEVPDDTYAIRINSVTSGSVTIGGLTYEMSATSITTSGPSTLDAGLLLLPRSTVDVQITVEAGADDSGVSVTLSDGYLLGPSTSSTDGSGIVTFSNVAPGSYGLRLSKTGVATVDTTIIVPDRSTGATYAPTTFTLTDVAPVSITITAKTSDAQIVPGATVRVTEDNIGCTTGSTGTCTLLLTPGTWTLSASHPNHPSVSSSITVVAGTPQSIDVSFATASTGDIDFTIEDTTGTAISGATVTSVDDATINCTTNGSGECSITNQPSEVQTYRISATDHSTGFVSVLPLPSSTVSATVQLPGVTPAPTTSAITFRTIDGSTGNALGSVLVQDVDDPTSPTAICTTDASTGICTPSTQSVGLLNVGASLAGYVTTSATITVGTNNPTTVVLALQPSPSTTASLAVTVVDETTASVSSVTIATSDGSMCTASNSCTISGLTTGATTVTITPSTNHEVKTVVAGLTFGQTTNMTVTVRRTGSLRIEVATSPTASATFAAIGFGTLCTIANPNTSCDGPSASQGLPFGDWLISGDGYANSSVSISASTLYTVTMSPTP
ncbi:MAG: carboxypeptidase regulatory-like domain-containing protein [Actinomycetota bacterium]|nr:carboxypeptidase regulatory-like domain-containing protein [Actinomycetota bacterium]MDA2971831.1 carboxypeptidase regulatory-like domain-containing protein [Actinomycetota bacterium]MDA3001254.1 carboxypeptidase regulatory-like domain-containing protein [Actinomycetota bacterium]